MGQISCVSAQSCLKDIKHKAIKRSKGMKILWIAGIFMCGAFAQSSLVHIMQNMEYAMNQMEKGFLYNKKEWIDEGLAEFKMLNKELQCTDPNTYLGATQRRNIDVVSGIVDRSAENIEVLERFLKQNEMIKSADVYGRILSGCVSCHAIARGW